MSGLIHKTIEYRCQVTVNLILSATDNAYSKSKFLIFSMSLIVPVFYIINKSVNIVQMFY